MWTSAAQWVSARRFAIASVFLFAVMCVHTWNGDWVGDFWEHSAVVRELQIHPFHPLHPLIRTTAPHQFFSPYALLVALWSRLPRIDAVTALALTGLVNLALLLYGLRRFVVALAPELPDAPFYALVLMLFLWGPGVWFFSGIFQVGVLGYVLPYPSTFAAAVSLLVLAHHAGRPRGTRSVAFEAFAGAIVLVTHPPTFAFLLAGFAGLTAGDTRIRDFRTGTVAAAVVVLSMALALLWPYFPVFTVILDASAFDATNEPLYRAVVARTWPALAGIPLLFATPSRLRRMVVVTIAVLLVPYVYGMMSGHFSYGRALPYIVLLLQIVTAAAVARLEQRWRRRNARRLAWLILPSAVSVALLLWGGAPIAGMLRYAEHRKPASARYAFLSRNVGQYDVVLTDPQTGLVVPTFGGKVVAVDRPLLFVPDAAARRSDVNRFLSSTDPSEQQEILDRYGVGFVLIAREFEPVSSRWSRPAADDDVMFDNREYVLISVGRPRR